MPNVISGGLECQHEHNIATDDGERSTPTELVLKDVGAGASSVQTEKTHRCGRDCDWHPAILPSESSNLCRILD